MNAAPGPLTLNGYVLAGGRSTRMGRDKAKICLAGKPLIAHATEKLRGLCQEVRILSRDQELAAYGELVPDLHPGCGPLGGVEAALAQGEADWHLFLPVDVPLIPAELLAAWAAEVLSRTDSGVRLAGFVVERELQPAVLLLHRDAAAAIETCVADKRLKLATALEWTAGRLAGELGVTPEQAFWRMELADPASARWFANLNTPEELSEAELSLSQTGEVEFGHH